VIGNSAYSVGPLSNPLKDAAAVAGVLRDIGFDRVLLRTNLGTDGMRAALKEFRREVDGAEIGLIYFAGHGTEIGGKNYLIPTDARLARASDVDLEAIALDTVLTQLDGVTKLKLVILDACRNNIFPLAGGKRALTRGLARVEPEDNTLIAYAAKEGTTADDGSGEHSPFTTAFLKHVRTSDLEVRFLFAEVRDDVLAATGRQQQPHLYGSLGRDRIVLAGSGIAAPSEQPPNRQAKGEQDRTTSLASPVAREAPSAPSQIIGFDGIWEISGVGGTKCPVKTWKRVWTIKGSEIQTGYRVPGQVSADGVFKFALPAAVNTSVLGIYSGKLKGSLGSGDYQFPNGCTGTFALKKL
jgi:hypothetical protein